MWAVCRRNAKRLGGEVWCGREGWRIRARTEEFGLRSRRGLLAVYVLVLLLLVVVTLVVVVVQIGDGRVVHAVYWSARRR